MRPRFPASSPSTVRVARYIRFRITNAADAEDILQNTLVAAWIGFRSIHDQKQLPAWLMQVAKNRCADYFRSKERSEVSLPEDTWQLYDNRFGLWRHQVAAHAVEVIDALETLPEAVREVAKQFYLQGSSIAEIAIDSNRPVGTIKRQLFQARNAARSYLGVEHRADQQEKDRKMENVVPTNSPSITPNPTAFPSVRPSIRIAELHGDAFAIDCRELRTWPIIPIVGETASCADYSLPGWSLGEVTQMKAVRAAKVHDVDATEIDVRSWRPGIGWQLPGSVYARLTEAKAEFLAVHLPQDDFTQIETFLDETFAWNWGAIDRAIAGCGDGIEFGLVTLEIGKNQFTCLRILEGLTDSDPTKFSGYITESYLTHEGRTLLVRRFCDPTFAERAQFPVLVDASDRLEVNGIAFLHWYDTITNLAL